MVAPFFVGSMDSNHFAEPLRASQYSVDGTP